MAHRVLVVDRHPLLRAGLCTVLSREGLVVAAEASTLEEALAVQVDGAVDLAVASEVETLKGLRSKDPTLAILALADPDEPVRIVELVRAGANSFAHKSQPILEIVEAIHETLATRRYIAPSMRAAVESMLASNAKLPADRLTGREREVFGLLVRGYSNGKVSTELGIAPRTVETHRQRVLKKLDAHSVADLVRLAAKWGVELT